MGINKVIWKQQNRGAPRCNEVIGVDRADEFGCVCVPQGDGVCVAKIGRGQGRVAASVIGDLPSNDARLIDVARNYKLYILVEFFSDHHIGIKFVMGLCYTKLLDIKIHTAYVISSQHQVRLIERVLDTDRSSYKGSYAAREMGNRLQKGTSCLLR